jgi:flagellar protein FlaG
MEVNKVNSTASFTAIVPESGAGRPPVDPELVQAVQAVNGAKLFGYDSELTFAMDRETRRFVVRLVDKDTRKVIRQIPAEYLLRMAQDLGEADQ